MRILVFGAGAVGSALGGMLASAGHAVTLLGRSAHMTAVRERGLAIEGIWGSHHVRVAATAGSCEELAGCPFDLVLVTVKSYDTASAAEAWRALGHAGVSIVSIQNGHGNTETLEAALGAGLVFGARIITGVEQPEPGRVVVTVSADDIRLGPPRGEPEWMGRAREIADIFRDAGVPVSATDQFRAYLWSKILYNCALNPLGALLRATYGELANDPGTRTQMERIIDEAFAAAQAEQIPMFWTQSDEYRRHFFEDLIPPTVRHYPSMLRDLERRGRTEIDALNGAVVRLAQKHAVLAPVNETLSAMIKLREGTRRAELELGAQS
jgi:2-dehydropantoate 2-reductase